MRKVMAYIHGLKVVGETWADEKNVQGEAIIVSEDRAIYNNKLCVATYNPFAGMWYVDDKYGVVKELTDSEVAEYVNA